MKLLLGLDQGTSGTKAYLMDETGGRVGLGYVPLDHVTPRSGWTEQDPNAVAAGATQAIELALRDAHARPADVVAVGIASQRGTDFVWDARTGRPLSNAITWQDLRTVPIVDEMDQWGHAAERRRRLGYFPGPWCASMHLCWRMRHQPEWRRAVEAGHARVGMSAGWLLAAIGTPAAHVHDYSLVQKIGLWDFRNGRYWPEWMAKLGLSEIGLPQPVPTLHDFGTLRLGRGRRGVEAPVTAMIGDQQAALFGHGCYLPGQTKCTHGTTSFVNVVVGNTPPVLEDLNVYHAWSLPTAVLQAQWPPLDARQSGVHDQAGPVPALQHTYCLEADTTTTGAALRWMVDQAGLLDSETELDDLAQSVSESGGVVFVPAFTGLHVPYHNHDARAALVGMTLGSTRAHIARAFLESIGYQVRAILETIQRQIGLDTPSLSVDGGLSGSDIACQIQSDVLGIPVLRPTERETTARGAALLAGLGAGVWRHVSELPLPPSGGTCFEPGWSSEQRAAGLARWQRIVAHVQEMSSI